MLHRIGRTLSLALALALACAVPAAAEEGDARVNGCAATASVPGCTSDPLLNGAYGVALSPDGKHAYVGTHNSHTLLEYTIGADGRLTRIAGSDACYRATPDAGDCLDGRSIDLLTDIIVSPDGKHVYVGGYSARGIAVFDRDATSGKLTQKAGTNGCVNDSGADGCADVRALGLPVGLTMSEDGKNVYALNLLNSITIFDRNATTGVLTQKANEAGCVNNDGSDTCAVGRAIGGFASQLVLSADGRHLYAPARDEGGILLFNRDTATGEIVQKAGTQGCITFDGSPNASAVPQCQDGSDALADTASLVFAPSSEHLYALTGSGIVASSRDPSTGILAQTSCVTEGGAFGCPSGTALSALWHGAFSPDGKDFVVTDFYAGGGTGLRFLRRNAQSGVLTQRATTAKCATSDGRGSGVAAACATQPSLGGYGLVRYSSGGRFFYAAQNGPGSAVALERDILPTCQSRSVDVPFETAVTVPLACNDANGDAITLQKLTDPSSGFLGAINQAGSVNYSPFAKFSGADSFMFRGVANGGASNDATISLNVAAPPPPPPPGITDADGDGSPAGTDCDDNNPRRRPGLAEVVSNGVDEDCDGKDLIGRVANTVQALWLAFRSYTTVTKLTVKGAPAGSTVAITCRGRGCPFKKKTFPQAAAGDRNLLKLFNFKKKKRKVVSKLRNKAVVEIRVTKPGWIGKVNRYTVRKNKKAPTSSPMCLPIGSTKPQKTC